MAFGIDITGIPEKIKNQVEAELPSRAVRAANALLNAKNEVLRGQRSGKMYGRHQASAPGESPANWSGHLRDSSFTPLTNDAHLPGIMSNAEYADYLESGTPGGMIAPRPYRQPIIDKAQQEVEAIYQEPWHISI